MKTCMLVIQHPASIRLTFAARRYWSFILLYALMPEDEAIEGVEKAAG